MGLAPISLWPSAPVLDHWADHLAAVVDAGLFIPSDHLPPPEIGGPKDVYTLENYHQYLIYGPEGGSQEPYNTVDLESVFPNPHVAADLS